MNNKKIMIVGVPVSGKTALIKLFDGHKNLRTVHTHEQIINFFFQIKDKTVNDISKKNNAIFYNYKKNFKSFKLKVSNDFIIDYNLSIHRKVLNEFTGHWVLEIWSDLGILPGESTSTVYSNEKFNFDFNKFDKNFKENLFNYGSVITAEEYIDIYYNTYFETWNDYSYDKSNFSTVFMGPNNPDVVDYVLREKFNIKIIYYSRDIVSRIITSSFKGSRYFEKNNEKIFEKIAMKDMLLDNSKKRMRKFKTKIKNFENKYSTNILEVTFDNVVFSTELEMKKICNYLNINFLNCLLLPSLTGNNVSTSYTNLSQDIDLAKSYKIIKFINFYSKPSIKYFSNLNFIITYFKYLILKILYKIFKRN